MKYTVELSAVLKCTRTIEANSEDEALQLISDALCNDDFNTEMWTEMLESDYEQYADHNIGAKVVGTTDSEWIDWPR